jgi:hypothetical protein
LVCEAGKRDQEKDGGEDVEGNNMNFLWLFFCSSLLNPKWMMLLGLSH